MTPRSPTRSCLRPLLALLAGSLVLALTPTGAAESLAADDLPLEKRGCTARTWAGLGEMTFAGQYQYSYDIAGHHTDGCGGKRCDDSVYGTVFYNDDGDSAAFGVYEVDGEGDDCTVVCQLGSSQWYSSGRVVPDDGDASFSCDGSFYGWISSESTNVRIQYLLPDVVVGSG